MFASIVDSWRTWWAAIPRAAKLAAAAVLVAVAAAVIFRGVLGGDSQPQTTGGGPPPSGTAARSSSTGAIMLRRSGSAVLGVLRSTDGAAAAAISYVQQRNILLTGGTTSAEAADVGSQIAAGGHDVGKAPASIPDRAADSSAEAMLATRSGQMAWWTLPTGYRVLRYAASGRSATVRIFSVVLTVQADPAAGPGTIAFALQDVRLRWIDDAWRIIAVKDAPDQPTPALIFAVNSRADAERLPVRERVIHGSDASSSGLWRWLEHARPLTLGPVGMAQIDGRPVTDPDALAIITDTAVGAVRQARSNRVLEGGRSGNWRVTVPVAYRPMACPDGNGEARCYTALIFATGTTDDEIATAQLALAGYRLSGAGTDLRTEALQVPLEDQEAVLGGRLNVAATVDDPRRTDLAAWQRSVVPLRPVVPAVAR